MTFRSASTDAGNRTFDQEAIRSNRVEVHRLSSATEVEKNKRSICKRRSLNSIGNAEFSNDLNTPAHTTRSCYLSRTIKTSTKNKSNSTFLNNHILSNRQPAKSHCRYKSNNQFGLILMIQFFIFLIVRHVYCQQVYPPNQFSNRNGAIKSWRIEEILPIGYNNQQPPMFNYSVAVQVDIAVKIRNIRFQPSKQDKGTSLFIDLDLIQSWRDNRLLIPAVLQSLPTTRLTLDYRWKSLLWTPMLMLTNAKQIQFNTFFDPIVFIEIDNRKQIYLNAKLSLELDCDYQLTKPYNGDNQKNQPEKFGRNFGLFPFDAKECGVEIISLSNTLETISLKWSNFDLPIQQTNEFLIESKRYEHCVTMFDTKTFSCVRARFKLKRKFLTAFINYQLPVILFVFIAYLTFWIPSRTAQSSSNLLNGHLIQIRVLILIYSLSALYLQIQSENTPKLLVSHQDSAYNTNNSVSLSIWYFVNLLFVLFAVVEFVMQLNQSSLRIFIVKKIIKDDLNAENGKNYGTNIDKQTTKTQLNTNNNNLSAINPDSVASNQSNDTNNYRQIKSKNKIYLKMLGLKQQPSLNKHQSSSHVGSAQQGKDWNGLENGDLNLDNKENIDWLDHLFRIFYPLFYVAFVFLFTFISLIS